MASARPLSASDLYAFSQGVTNQGDTECHWCAAAAAREHAHDDDPPVPFARSRSTARRPNNAYVCRACWLWRRKSVTVEFLGGGRADRQRAYEHSWWIVPEGAWAVRPGEEKDRRALWERLLLPPHTFCLALVDGAGMTNGLQLAYANDHKEVLRDTTHAFTVNGIPQTFSVYELEEGLRRGVAGKMPGVQTLVRLLGTHPLPPEPERTTARGGRPAKDGDPTPPLKRAVKSGSGG